MDDVQAGDTINITGQIMLTATWVIDKDVAITGSGSLSGSDSYFPLVTISKSATVSVSDIQIKSDGGVAIQNEGTISSMNATVVGKVVNTGSMTIDGGSFFVGNTWDTAADTAFDIKSGTVTFNAGTIMGGTSSAVSVSGGNVSIAGTTEVTGLSWNATPAAVSVTSGSVSISGDAYINECATGVSVTGGSLTIDGGRISFNEGGEAGGVLVSGQASFRMTGGEVSQNTGTLAGGILILDNTGSVISGGSVSMNKIGPQSSGGSAGIGLSGTSSLNLIGGAVRWNHGHGISALDGTCSLFIGGAGYDPETPIKVSGNPEEGTQTDILIHRYAGDTSWVDLDVTIAGPLTGSEVWFSMADSGSDYTVDNDTDFMFAELSGDFDSSMTSALRLVGTLAIPAYVDSDGSLKDAAVTLTGGGTHTSEEQGTLWFTYAFSGGSTLYVIEGGTGIGTRDNPYGQIADAVRRAAYMDDEVTIELLSDLTYQDAVDVVADVTLDLAGFDIFGRGDDALVLEGSGSINVEGPGTITALGHYGDVAPTGISGSTFDGTLTIGQGVSVRGGDGADGTDFSQHGRDGGAGIYIPNGYLVLHGATVTAGDGGDGYSGETPGAGGSGGVGAEAAALSSSSSTVVAGSGGSGGSSSSIAQGGDGGDGGDGGAALSVAGSIEAEDSTFAGGDGGNGGLSGTSTPSSGGNGGSVNSAGTQVSGGTEGSAGSQGDTVQGGAPVTVYVYSAESAEVHLVSGGVTRAFGIIENDQTSVTLRVPAGIYNLKVVSGGLVRTQGCDVPSGGRTVSVDLSERKDISTEVEGSGDVVLVGGDLSAAVTGEDLDQYTSFDVIMNVDAVDALYVPDVRFPVSYDITIEKALYDDSMFVGTKNVENLSSSISFAIGIESVISELQNKFKLTSGYGEHLVVYAQHGDGQPESIYYELVESGGSYYVKVRTDQFSTFSVGYSVCTLTIKYENDTPSPVTIEVLRGQTVDITSYINTSQGYVCRTSIDPSGTGGSVSFDETDGRYTYTAGTTSATLTISYLPQHKVTILQVCGNQESQHVIQVVEGEDVDITWYLTMSGYEASVSIYPSDTGGSIYGNIYIPGTTDATITITFTPIEVPPPPTVITAEAEDNLVTITVANPQSGREYAVRDGAGDLQTTWTSGTGILRGREELHSPQ